MENEEKKGKTTGAKNLSKWTMCFASVWIAVLTVMKGLKLIDLSITDIVASAGFMCVVWSPAYTSIFMDKIKDIKLCS